MISQSSLRGYVLEEFIARLIKDSGYDLLVHPSQDSFALQMAGNELNIYGRGALHQVDVLGQLRSAVPLSYPLRMFIEAKFRKAPTGLPVLRNALGVVNDVNEHYSWRTAKKHSPDMSRYDYRYVILSTSGFTDDAIQYAVTQRLSLGDLSTPAFRWLRDAADSTATALLKLAEESKITTFPVRQTRKALRKAFGTWPADLRLATRPILPRDRLRAIAEQAAERVDNQLYVGFATNGPFIVFLQPDDPGEAETFLTDQLVVRPTQRNTTLAQSGHSTEAGEWLVTTDSQERPVTLRLAIPPGLAPWIVAEPTLGEDGDAGVPIAAGSRPRRDRSLMIAVDNNLAEVTFQPVPATEHARDESDEQSTSPWRRPDLTYRDEVVEDEPSRPRWSLGAFEQLLRYLQQETGMQAEIIKYAAKHRGRISRGEVYEVAGFPPSRSLRGFTRPARRITRQLIRQGLVSPDAPWPLHTQYAGSSVQATHFLVPAEFIDYIHRLTD